MPARIYCHSIISGRISYVNDVRLVSVTQDVQTSHQSVGKRYREYDGREETQSKQNNK